MRIQRDSTLKNQFYTSKKVTKQMRKTNQNLIKTKQKNTWIVFEERKRRHQKSILEQKEKY